MHQTTVSRYVRANQDVWRVVCAECGVLADDLSAYEAGRTRKMLARQTCSSDSLGQGSLCQGWSSDGMQGSPDTDAGDKQILALWTGQDVSAGAASRAW